MKLYRNHKGRDGEESDGYVWFATKKEAFQNAKEIPESYDWQFGTVAECIEFDGTKRDLVRMLNSYADHPDNG